MPPSKKFARYVLPEKFIKKVKYPKDSDYIESDMEYDGERVVKKDYRSSEVAKKGGLLKMDTDYLDTILKDTFGVDCVVKDLQVLRYSTGDFFKPHTDRNTKPGYHIGTLLIFPPEDEFEFEGGTLKVSGKAQDLSPDRWVLVTFGFVKHQVLKVRSGCRIVFKFEVHSKKRIEQPKPKPKPKTASKPKPRSIRRD